MLLPNWKKLLWGSWSSRLAIAASVLGCVELLLPLFQDLVPRGPFALASITLAILVPVARIVAQPGLHPDA
jgi:hypothetical protein